MRNSKRKSISKTTYLKKSKAQDNNGNYTFSNSNAGISCDFFDLGDKAPDFTLTGIVDKNPAQVTLSDYKEKWVVLFFYGSDFTFV